MILNDLRAKFDPRFFVAISRTFEFLSKHSLDWLEIRKIQTLSIVRSMYIWLFIVPFLAKSFSKIEDIATISIFEYKFSMVLELPFSWLVFYASSIAFVLANVLYQLYCPELIKEHINYSSFTQAGKLFTHLKEYEKHLISTNVKHDVPIPPSKYLVPDEKSEEKSKIALFWDLHTQAKKKNPLARFLATYLGYIGFVLISWVGIQNLYSVIWLI